MEINLKIKFCGVTFPNPFVVAKVPPLGSVEVIASQLAAGWGGVLLRNASLKAEPEKPTLTALRSRTPLYRGVDFEEKRLLDLGWIEPEAPISLEESEKAITTLKEKFPDRIVIAGMVGANRDEWLKVSRRLNQVGADLIECDFSVKSDDPGNQNLPMAQDPKLMEKAARYVRDGARNTPVMIKLPGTLPDKDQTVEILKEAGVDGINLFYEPKGIPGINLTNFVPFPNVGAKSAPSTMGGVAVKPYTLAVLAEWGKANRGLDVSVLGGAYSWRDCVEFVLMGASLLQFHGAVLQRGEILVDDLRNGVSDYLAEKMISSVDKLVGKSLPFLTSVDKLPRSSARVVAAIDDKLCTRCGICFRVCNGLGYFAINFSPQRKPTIDKKKCVGDGLCVAACPVVNCMSLRRLAK
ncbi:MAG TPA: 4Fe-4S dicluster-binding protein [Candidatus Glassbacteria bacterium]|nr:4Fe-4S dicluster-binding protein [Candidatus Glassbacteria bacterium]